MILSSRKSSGPGSIWVMLQTSDANDGATVVFHVLPVRGDTLDYNNVLYRVSDVRHEIRDVAGEQVQCITLVLERKYP